MSKTLRALFVAASIATTAGTATAGSFLDIPPAEGLPVCAGVYATLFAYADPEDKAVLKQRSTVIAMASRRYDPNGPDRALALAKQNIAKINAGDVNTANTVAAAEKNCRVYTAKYGI